VLGLVAWQKVEVVSRPHFNDNSERLVIPGNSQLSGVAPPVSVLGVRPHRSERGRCVYEKFGDYNLKTSQIRVWMRTAKRREVTAYGTLLSTFCHELCHHLDVVSLGLPDSPHTRGFFERAALLYHRARGSPQRRLVWLRLPDGRYRIDWRRTMGR
jgi:hypothetical protein